MLENPPSVFSLGEGGSLPRFDGAWTLSAKKSSCTLSRKTAQSIMSPPPCLTAEMFCGDVLWDMLSISDIADRVDAKELHFGFIWPHFLPCLSESFRRSVANLRVCTYAFSAAGSCRRCKISIYYTVACYHSCPWWLLSHLPSDH